MLSQVQKTNQILIGDLDISLHVWNLFRKLILQYYKKIWFYCERRSCPFMQKEWSS